MSACAEQPAVAIKRAFLVPIEHHHCMISIYIIYSVHFTFTKAYQLLMHKNAFLGIDSDAYVTVFNNGTTVGADNVMASFGKAVDVAVYSAVKSFVSTSRTRTSTLTLTLSAYMRSKGSSNHGCFFTGG